MAVDTPDWMQMSQLAAPVLLGQCIQANGATSATVIVNEIPFLTGWQVVFANELISFAGASIDVIDAYSGVQYYQTLSALSNVPPLAMPVTGLSAAGVTVIMSALPLNSSGFARTVAFIFGLFGTGVQIAYNTPLQPLYTKEVPDPFSDSLGGGLTSVVVSNNLAASGSATIITAVAGKTVTVYGYDMSINPVALVVGSYEVLYEDTTAAKALNSSRVNISTAVGIASERNALWIPPGLALPLGAGLKAVANAANAGNALADCTIFYTQQ